MQLTSLFFAPPNKDPKRPPLFFYRVLKVLQGRTNRRKLGGGVIRARDILGLYH